MMLIWTDLDFRKEKKRGGGVDPVCARRITIDLHDAREAREMARRTFRRVVGRVDVGNSGRLGSASWPVVGGRPRIGRFCEAPALIGRD
jgi:hypothetical protein